MSNSKPVNLFLVEQRAKERWASDPQLREEFLGEFEHFLAFERADAQGRIRIYGQNRGRLEGGK